MPPKLLTAYAIADLIAPKCGLRHARSTVALALQSGALVGTRTRGSVQGTATAADVADWRARGCPIEVTS